MTIMLPGYDIHQSGDTFGLILGEIVDSGTLRHTRLARIEAVAEFRLRENSRPPCNEIKARNRPMSFHTMKALIRENSRPQGTTNLKLGKEKQWTVALSDIAPKEKQWTVALSDIAGWPRIEAVAEFRLRTGHYCPVDERKRLPGKTPSQIGSKHSNPHALYVTYMRKREDPPDSVSSPKDTEDPPDSVSSPKDRKTHLIRCPALKTRKTHLIRCPALKTSKKARDTGKQEDS
ncbi:unnamed protein product [Rodentolepis nana]|uniref:DUF5641 domain-containing protein n=1 Tax=Rodentolepis nana TaxID=102285 RepID=A0A0R3TDV4_RODNA|nr:unnamed protein product [Rodentolepis nana]